jgi:hypothetical protein
MDVVMHVREQTDGTFHYSLHLDREFMPEAGRSERPEGEGGEPPKLAALEGAPGTLDIVPREEFGKSRGLGRQSPDLRGPDYRTPQERTRIRALTDELRAELDRLGLEDIGLRVVERLQAMIDGKSVPAGGQYWQRAITLALQSPSNPQYVLQHEVVHALRELGLFTDPEWALLEQASNARWRRQYDIDRRYAGRPEEERIEEGVANAYADWKAGRMQSDGMLNRLFRRIDNFLAALRLALRKAFGGSATVEDIFRAIERGEVGRRPRTRQGRAEGARLAAGLASQPRRQGIPAAATEPIATFRNDQPLKRHPDYRAAKAGDTLAASRLARDLVTTENLDAARQRFGSNVVYVPVVAIEQSGHNRIPLAVAEQYASQTDADTTADIVQTNQALHTGAGPMERLTIRAVFDGDVTPGTRYVLVDDTSVMGSTLADLANHSNGEAARWSGRSCLSARAVPVYCRQRP